MPTAVFPFAEASWPRTRTSWRVTSHPRTTQPPTLQPKSSSGKSQIGIQPAKTLSSLSVWNSLPGRGTSFAIFGVLARCQIIRITFRGPRASERERDLLLSFIKKPILLALSGTWNVTRKANKTWCSPCIFRNL